MMAGDQRFTKFGTALADLNVAWRDRLDDADTLLASNRHASAIVMGLFALEIYLKTLICKRLGVHQLPKAFEVHDLDGLLLLAGLSRRLLTKRAATIRSNWNFIVRTSDRLNEMRYAPNARWGPADAQTFFEQLRGTPAGVLPWLMRQR